MSPDGQRVLVVNSDKDDVRLVDLFSSEELLRGKLHTAKGFSFSPDGRQVAAGSFRTGVYLLGLPISAGDLSSGGQGRQLDPVTDERRQDKVPKSFSFELLDKLSDPDKGIRFWTRTDGGIVIERYPSGMENRFKILTRATVTGIEGTIAEKVGFERFQIFIPDCGNARMEIKSRFVETPEEWAILGVMTKVE